VRRNDPNDQDSLSIDLGICAKGTQLCNTYKHTKTGGTQIRNTSEGANRFESIFSFFLALHEFFLFFGARMGYVPAYGRARGGDFGF
jgi:hypothetical protein